MMSAENLIYIIRLAIFLPHVSHIVRETNLNIKLKRLNYFNACNAGKKE